MKLYMGFGLRCEIQQREIVVTTAGGRCSGGMRYGNSLPVILL